MFSYKRINNLTGWLTFLIAAIVYILTLEPTASFWDCGEFIAVSHKLMTPHPPGAPLFLLLGRLFSLFAAEPEQVAYWTNMVSALSSAFTILFLFWSITYIARKLLALDPDAEPEKGQTFGIIGAGLIGSLAYTFTDSFWFSAVESEVYALSAMFTAAVVWVMLKWESVAHKPGADRWLLLIAYFMGLSIGVHLLNLVAIPALAFIYYFKNYKYTINGAILTFVISFVLLFFILVIVIPGLPSIAGWFEVKFVNSLGAPFNTGSIIFGILLLGGLIFGVVYSHGKKKHALNLSFLSVLFILIGYSSYAIIVIRSNYDPPIDENNPEDVMKFVSYLKREQYGDRPLFFGPQFTAGRPSAGEGKGAIKYKKGKEKYEPYAYEQNLEYDQEHVTLLPRMHSQRGDHVRYYKYLLKAYGSWSDGEKPSFSDNWRFFFSQQIGFYYLRYFGWNFIGRESDEQDLGVLWPAESKDVPYLLKSKARNQYWGIPLIIGLIGLVYHVRKHKKDAFVIGLLFLFTGAAIIFYLNAPPHEPRERDYTYAGSFFAFSIWIGLGVLAIIDAFKNGKIVLISGKKPVVIPFLKLDDMKGAIVATVICSIVPIILAAENWDDHDRSGRYYSVDSARNLLDSCAPNAILFTGGDNDTFPLWYVQEVEGYRKDVRVCNLSLLNTYWYIDLMKMKNGPSEPLPISFTQDQYFENNSDYSYYVNPERQRASDPSTIVDKPMNVAKFVELVQQNNPQVRRSYDKTIDAYHTLFPSKHMVIKFDLNATLALDENKGRTEGDQAMIPNDPELKAKLVNKLDWQYTKDGMEKKHLIMLDMIANIAKNNWDRPIYWSTTVSRDDQMGLNDYMIMEGLAYRLTPIKHGGVKTLKEEKNGTKQLARVGDVINTEIMKRNMVEKFHWRGLDDENAFYNEDYYRMVRSSRDHFYKLAKYMLLFEGDKEGAKEVADYAMKTLPEKTFKWRYNMIGASEVYYDLGETEKADEISERIMTTMQETVLYLESNQNYHYAVQYKENDLKTQYMTTAYQVLQIWKVKEREDLVKKYESWVKDYMYIIQRPR